VRALVDLHGGTFKLESEPGKGTTVSVRFSQTRILRTEIKAAG
jgi:signal transduction histidine kinase